MKLKDEFIKLPKELVYDMYNSLVYDTVDYDDITRGKMLDSIIAEYNNENYLYHICTEKELKFLEYIGKNKLNKKSIEKYDWEIKELNNKGIFSRVTFEVFDEQKSNVDGSLTLYNKNIQNKKYYDDIVIFIISIVKINVELLTKALESMILSLFHMDKENFSKLLGHPLIHFYCYFDSQYCDFSNDYEEFIIYRENWDLLPDLEIARKKYGISGSREYDLRDNYDIFYYGFPISNPKVKKMYDAVKKLPGKDFIFSLINETRILYNDSGLEMFVTDKKLLNIIREALKEIPCAAMNGFTPRKYENENLKINEIKFPSIPQNNAHLCKKSADEFYKLYFAILDYTNQKYNIDSSIGKIYKQQGIDATKLVPINNYLFSHKEIIDDFIKENPNKLSVDELDIIAGFKNSLTSEKFVIVGYDREYTQILADNGKVYMVKGVRCDLDKILNGRELPIIISTTLLMFKGNIIYNSFLSEIPLSFGSDMLEMIMKDYEQALRCYHL